MVDANGTRFHLLFGRDDWAAALAAPDSSGLAFEAQTGSVALARVVERFPARSGAPRLTAEDRRGADADQFGNWYWIAADRRTIRTWRAGSRPASDYWHADLLDAEPCPPDADAPFAEVAPPGPRFADLLLSGLAVTTRHYLLVGTLRPSGLLVFDLHAYGPPEFRLWPAALDLRPFDIARAAGGGAWLLDRGDGWVRPARLWRLDDRLRPVALAGLEELAPPRLPDFAPPGSTPQPEPATTFPAGLPLEPFGSPAELAAEAPIAIAGLPDDTVLVLDSPPSMPSALLRIGGGRLLGRVELDAGRLSVALPPPAEIRGHAMAFLPDPAAPAGELRGALVVVDDQGDQAFRFAFAADAWKPDAEPSGRLELELVADFLPLRRFAGKALVAQAGRAYYDLDERWMPVVASPRRRRLREGAIGAVCFEGAGAGTVWHRIVIDGCIPPGTRLAIEARAADDRDELARAEWRPVPDPYRRADGPEVPFWDPFDGAGDAARGLGSWETLLQEARGRLIELRFRLAGDGRASPRLTALRLHFPRFSYLERYLPAIYRQEPVSAGFLERFLANVEGLFTALEDRVAAAQGLFDTRTAPPEWLDWLAGWLGASLDPDWDDTRRRLFIEHAELLFRWRGTPAGLKAMIDLTTEDCADARLFAGLSSGRPPAPDAARRGVRIVEGFALRQYGGVALGDAGAGAFVATDWTPEQGAGPLHRRFADFALARRGSGLAPEAALVALAEAWGRSAPFAAAGSIRLSAAEPPDPGEAEDWRAFMAGPIGFAYAPVSAADAPAWRAFLSRRYRRIDQLKAAHQLAGPNVPADFDSVELPGELPSGGARLADWIGFVSLAQPMAAAAHRFTVLAPAEPGEETAARQARLERVAAIVEREKPAHTLFEVKPFWALFQAGRARLGIDTALGAGARFTAIELGRTALGEGYVGYGHPYAVRDRIVTGRDRAGEMRL